MQSLQAGLGVIRCAHGGAFVALHGTGGKHLTKGHHACVDLVEGQPVFDLILVALKDGLAVVHVETDQLAGSPAVVLFHQSVGQLVVADGDQRLDAVLLAAVEHTVVELQTLLIGFRFPAVGEDAGPVDGGAEGLEAQLGKQGDILLVVVVEIDRLMAGVQTVRVDGGGHPLGHGVGTVGAHIGHAGALAVHIPCALKLVGSTGAAPQEIIAENAHSVFLLCSADIKSGAGPLRLRPCTACGRSLPLNTDIYETPAKTAVTSLPWQAHRCTRYR